MSTDSSGPIRRGRRHPSPPPKPQRRLPLERWTGPGLHVVAGLVRERERRVEVTAAQLDPDVREQGVRREQRHVVDPVADQVEDRERFAVVVRGDVDDAELETVRLVRDVDHAQAKAVGGARQIDDADLRAVGALFGQIEDADLRAVEGARDVGATRDL